jgi:hypothetical protein
MGGFRAQRYEVPKHVSILVTEIENSVHYISQPKHEEDVQQHAVQLTLVTAELVSKETHHHNTMQHRGNSSEI